ncbi:MAG TPA: carboxylesterase/lipase family protein [Jatrophihabitantaceae bacterium]|nr:carboxylesterase/lipase family protein [Jatrophihabitantaceae bacterium]
MTPGQVVGTTHGPVRGTAAAGVLAFLGVPYAAPPVGELRFRPPAPPRAWAEPRDCTAHGPTAPQAPPEGPVSALLPHVSIPGADHLNLNVWTADTAGSRPVMVFVHGGSFTSGAGSIPTYDGSRFARDGVVLVTVNYRLGADGFLWLGAGTANLGLLDQVAALEWVRDNIASFGGDPSNVTVFGESAGAMSVCTLLAMPAASGLFRRAIAQSGAARCVLSADTAARIGRSLCELLGVEPSREAVAAVPTSRLLSAQVQLALDVAGSSDPLRWGEDAARNIMPFEPVVDGHVLPVAPEQALADGASADVDLMIGTNADEGNLFFVPTGITAHADEAALAHVARSRCYPRPVVDAYRAAHPTASPGELISELMTGEFYRAPALQAALSHRGSYMYEFAWRSPAFDGRMGACHALELPFVFDTLDGPGYGALLGEAPPQAVADAMHRAWIAFATTGDPGWPAYETTTRAAMRFDTASTQLTDYR